jgi:hypothetical protein
MEAKKSYDDISVLILILIPALYEVETEAVAERERIELTMKNSVLILILIPALSSEGGSRTPDLRVMNPAL